LKAISFLSASNPLNFDKAGRLVSLRVLGTRRKLAKASFNTCHRALRDLHAEALGDRALRPIAAPADNAIQRQVLRRLNDLVEFGKLVFAQERLVA
jgi:hypothetical protein